MAHYPTIMAGIAQMDEYIAAGQGDIESKFHTTAECGRLLRRHLEATLRARAAYHDVDLRLTEAKGWLESTFEIVAFGSVASLRAFLSDISALETT